MDETVSDTDTIFEAALAHALELRDAGREDWLEAACVGTQGLHEQIRHHVEAATEHCELFKQALFHDAACNEVLADRYRLDERLGAGAMGIVYRARDLMLARDVAVKVLRTDMLDPNEAVSRFMREAELLASLRHPAIVTVFDRGVASGDRPFIVMELLDGFPLSELLDEGRRCEGEAFHDRADWLESFLSLDELGHRSYLRLATRWIADLAAGLEVAHRAGIMHRDIKPANAFICTDGRAVLLDFGVAAREDLATLTREGAAVGTPVYMAPESIGANHRPRPTADVYGLTATLYHTLTLRPPYSGSATQVLASILSQDPAPAAALRPGLPRDLQAILDKGLDRRPETRYASAGHLESDLRAFLEYRPIAARPIGSLRRWIRRTRRSKVAQGAVAALAVIALVAGGVLARSWLVKQRQVAHLETLRRLPPNFTVVERANRPFRYETDHEHVAQLLDRAAETCSDPLPSFLLRASFRSDHGDPQGAYADMRHVAEHVGSPLAVVLAERYAALEPGATVPLGDLPEIEADADVYLLAYHALRNADYESAHERLADPRIADFAHAQELRLAATSFAGLGTEDQRSLATQAVSEAIRLEERLGARTAATAHLIARMLAIQGRYAEALGAARDSVALAERSHPSRITAGMMAWRLGLDDEARQHWLVAMDLQPHYLKPYRNLIWLHLDRGELDEAELLVERAPFSKEPEDTAGEQQRLSYRARIETERALAAQGVDDDAMLEHAQRAAVFVERARALGPMSPDAYVEINEALLGGQPQGVFTGIAALLREDPLRWRRLELLLEHMPDDLDPEATRMMRAFCEALHAELASARRQVADQ